MAETVNEAADSAGNPVKDGEEEKPPCANCKKIDCDKATLAERFCIKCEEMLCISCSKEHEKKEEHLIVALNYQKESKKCKEFDFCIDHNDELAELFCISCRKIICSKCLEESHSSHNCSRVQDVADLVSKQTEAEYENLCDIQSHFDKEREKLCNEKVRVMKTVKEMETEIKKRCDEITEFVYNETNALLKELDVFKCERLEEIEMESRKMEKHAFAFEKFKEYCDQIKSNTNPRYTCEAEGVLRNIADDLKTRPEGSWKSGLFSIQFSIEKTDIRYFLSSLSAAVGKFTVRCPYKMKQSTEIKLHEKEVYGMAKLHDKLYVLSNSISIRRLQHPFASFGEIKTPDFKSPNDILSCSKMSCLYVYDKGSDCIWKVSVPDHRVSRWLDKVKQPNAVSVTSNAELLMLRNNTPVCLEVYNEHAILVQRCRLPATVPLLQRVCETASGKFIGLGGQSIYVFTRDGSIISQFQPSDDPQYRGKPQCLCLSPCHIFLCCSSTYEKKIEQRIFSGFRHFSVKDSDTVTTVHCGTISSLTFDLASHQILVDKSANWRTSKTSCYLKETKQLLFMEEIVSGKDKFWNLRAYDVLPE